MVSYSKKTIDDGMPRAKSMAVFLEFTLVPMLEELATVLFWVHSKWPNAFVLTSGYRLDSSEHAIIPLSAADLRTWYFEDPRAAAKDVNEHFRYDNEESKAVCLFHRTIKCLECRGKEEVDPVDGMAVGFECVCGNSDPARFKDFGPHFHLRSCRETIVRY